MRRKGIAEIKSGFHLTWQSEALVKDRGRNCAFYLVAQILTTSKTPVGALEGYVVLSHRLLSMELATLCNRLSDPMAELAEEIMEHRIDLYVSSFFFIQGLALGPRFRGQQLGPAVVRTMGQIGRGTFGVELCYLKPIPVQHLGQVGRAANHPDYRGDVWKLVSYLQRHLPIYPLREGSRFFLWQLP